MFRATSNPHAPEIIGEIQRHPNARIFSFGIGSSINRFLLDKMAEGGRGEVEYVALNAAGSKAAKRFHEQVRIAKLKDLARLAAVQFVSPDLGQPR